MAAEVVGVAFLSAALQVLFDRLASRRVLNFLRVWRIDEGKLEKLKTRLLAINAVLDDAKKKQIVNPRDNEFLSKLKNVVYDAEDLLDLIDYEALRCEVEGKHQTNIIDKVQNLTFSLHLFNKNTAVDLEFEKTLETLENMEKEVRLLKLNESVGQRPQKPESSSLVQEAVIYGREGDIEAVMKSLVSEDPCGMGIGVIPIVGMGGIGKTTSAQLLYNDNNVKELFDVRAWVCVFEESDVSKTTRTMLQEVTSQLPSDNQTLNQLQLKLKDQLTERKFLIVLDNVWYLNHDNWGRLLSPLKFGAKASRIILTIRDETIASIVQTLPICHLAQLSTDSSWMLFKQNAFEDVNFSPPPSIESIGRKIVDKRGRLPLAVKAIAGALRSRVDVAEWEQILESEMWRKESVVLCALRLSYHHLPSQLKRCFTYCSIFPKDYKIEKEMLVQLWMADIEDVDAKEGDIRESKQIKDEAKEMKAENLGPIGAAICAAISLAILSQNHCRDFCRDFCNSKIAEPVRVEICAATSDFM